MGPDKNDGYRRKLDRLKAAEYLEGSVSKDRFLFYEIASISGHSTHSQITKLLARYQSGYFLALRLPDRGVLGSELSGVPFELDDV